MAKTTTTDIAPTAVVASPYAVIGDPDAMLAIQENIIASGEQLSAFAMPRVKVPSGGGQAWEIPSFGGEIDIAREVQGIIVSSAIWRGYWPERLGEGGGGMPPACASDDGAIGTGDPGGACVRCPMNAWKSDERGIGKACKEMRALFILPEGAIFPTLLLAPPTSIKPMTQYQINLANNRRPYWQVVTAIGLSKQNNGRGNDYSVLSPRMVRPLTPEEIDTVKAYRTQITPFLKAQMITVDDVDTPNGRERDGEPLGFE